MAGRRRRELPAERRERLSAVEDPEEVLAAALRFLEVRSRSEAEVRRRLIISGYRPDLVDGAIARLTAIGILDDEAFARAWVESRDRARPRGERALARELALKGVDREVARGVLAERETPAREDDAGSADGGGSTHGGRGVRAAGVSVDEAAARRLVARRASALNRIVDPRERRRRAYALLARNGFDPETAARVSASLDARGEDAAGDDDEVA